MYCFLSPVLVALIGLEVNPAFFSSGGGLLNLDLHISIEIFYSYNPGQNC